MGIVKKSCKQLAVLISKQKFLKFALILPGGINIRFWGTEYFSYKVRNVLDYIAIENGSSILRESGLGVLRLKNLKRIAALSDFSSKVCVVFTKAYGCEKLLNYWNDLKLKHRSEWTVKTLNAAYADSRSPKLIQTLA